MLQDGSAQHPDAAAGRLLNRSGAANSLTAPNLTSMARAYEDHGTSIRRAHCSRLPTLGNACPPAATSKYVRDFKGVGHRSLAATHRFRTIKICPKDAARVWQHSEPSTHTVKATGGARHERHDLEGRPGEAGLDAAFGHRLGDGLFYRDYPTRTFMGKRSGVRPAPFVARVHEQLATERMPAPHYAAHEFADRRVSTGRSPDPP
jgi:hypothetical protein